jgi:hypothetical protein
MSTQHNTSLSPLVACLVTFLLLLKDSLCTPLFHHYLWLLTRSGILEAPRARVACKFHAALALFCYFAVAETHSISQKWNPYAHYGTSSLRALT